MKRTSLFALCCAAFAASECAPTASANTAIFTLAVDGARGGALLSAWVEPGTDHRAWLVGGLLGVDPATVPDRHVGRLVRYERGTLETLCYTDRVLWWVHGVRDGASTVVYAAGEGGRVVRYRDGQCETLSLDVTWPEGVPTFWGLWARSRDDVTFVGGSIDGGPRGVVVRYDGAHFYRQDSALPDSVRDRNLYKIAEGALGSFIVGERATILQRNDASTYDVVTAPLTTADNRVFTVSCDHLTPVCFAVGGAGLGFVLRGDARGWSRLDSLGEIPGLAGVVAQDANSVFVVGSYGFTLHTNVLSYFTPAVPTTHAALHGVSANASLVIAVGGELDNPSLDQRAVVLVRGETTRSFLFDGVSYTGAGGERPTLGSGVSGRQ